MATQPHKPSAPAKPAPRVEASAPDDEPVKQAPEPVKTAADEQRERSDEMLSGGFQNWKDKQDERSEEEKKPRQVAGVAEPRPEAKAAKK